MSSFQPLLERCAGKRMAVLGDLGADCYVETHPERLSREAPVMILKYERRRYAPGCSANTVMNLRSLGADVLPLGIVGDDEAGAAVLSVFEEAGIPTDGIVVRASFWTLAVIVRPSPQSRLTWLSPP